MAVLQCSSLIMARGIVGNIRLGILCYVPMRSCFKGAREARNDAATGDCDCLATLTENEMLLRGGLKNTSHLLLCSPPPPLLPLLPLFVNFIFY